MAQIDGSCYDFLSRLDIGSLFQGEKWAQFFSEVAARVKTKKRQAKKETRTNQ